MRACVRACVRASFNTGTGFVGPLSARSAACREAGLLQLARLHTLACALRCSIASAFILPGGIRLNPRLHSSLHTRLIPR